jgi:aquaporin NIP
VRKQLAEAIGTFAIVFAGTGAIVIDQQFHGVISHAGVAMTFGLVVLAMIYAFGEDSGAHFNPAVTLSFAAAGRFRWADAPGYIAAQLTGALAGSALLKGLFPTNATLGGTVPAAGVGASLVLEAVLTFLLMLVILQVSVGAREKGITAGIAIGATVGLEAMFAGPACGASMNPARSLGPALVSGQFDVLWIYLVGPVLGALAAIPAHRGVQRRPEIG